MSLPRSVFNIAIASAILGFTSPALAQTPAKIAVRAAYIPVVTWLPAMVALDTGIFEHHGLDVSMTVIQNPGLLPGTVGKQFDLVPTTPTDLINAAAKGLDVVAIAGGFIESSARRSIEVIVRKDSGIAGPKDLKGKRIASAALGSLIHISTLYWLKQNGVDANSIQAVEVPFPNMPDQLKAERIDAVEALQPFVTPLLAAGNVTIGDPALAVADPTVGTMWMGGGTWAHANIPTIKAWNDSLTEGTDFIKNNPEKSRAILAKYTRLPEAVAQTVPIPDYNVVLTPESLEPWINVLTDLGQLSKPMKADSLIVQPN